MEIIVRSNYEMLININIKNSKLLYIYSQPVPNSPAIRLQKFYNFSNPTFVWLLIPHELTSKKAKYKSA